jgi:heat shock protein HspQ
MKFSILRIGQHAVYGFKVVIDILHPASQTSTPQYDRIAISIHYLVSFYAQNTA